MTENKDGRTEEYIPSYSLCSSCGLLVGSSASTWEDAEDSSDGAHSITGTAGNSEKAFPRW